MKSENLLSKIHLLDDKILTEAFYILFDKNWKKYWTEKDKSREMKSIFNGGTQPCVSFEKWVKCIEFLYLNI